MKLVLVLCALVAGCAKKTSDTSDKIASCLVEATQSCREYRGDNLALGTESLQKLCTALVSSAKFVEAPCPTARMIGKCAKHEGTDFYYEGYVQSAQELEALCKQGNGTFTTK
jgi:hypothetical protein